MNLFCRILKFQQQKIIASSMDSEFSLLDVVRCELCEVPAPSLCCKSCHLKLCQACGGEHVLDESKTHNIVVIERPQYPICHKHVNYQCLFYCEKCSLSLCTLCLPLKEHEEHNIVDILEIGEQKRDILQKDLKELEQIIFPNFQNIATEISVQKVDVQKKKEKMKKSISEQGQKLHKHIDDIMNEMETKVTDTVEKQLKALNKIEKDIKQRISEIEKIISDIKGVQKLNDVSLISAHKSCNSEFRRYSPKTAMSSINFSAPDIDTNKLQTIFGSLSEITPKKRDLTISVPIGVSSEEKYLLNDFEVSTSVATRYKGFMKELRSACCLNDDEIWTCGNSTILRLYNLRGEVKEVFKTSSGNMPQDIAVTRRGYLVYTDFKAKSLTIVKNTQRRSAFEITFDSIWKPRNVCSTFSDDLLVSMESDDQKQTKIVRLAGLEYKPCIEIQFDSNGRPLFSHGGYDKAISENMNLDICIADFGAGELVVVDQNGKLRFRYTASTLILEQKKSFHPRGVTTDSQSHILTSDHFNHIIHILDKNGQFLCHIGNCVQRPWGLCVDSRDNLFVAEFFSGEVKKIRYCRESKKDIKEPGEKEIKETGGKEIKEMGKKEIKNSSLTMCCVS